MNYCSKDFYSKTVVGTGNSRRETWLMATELEYPKSTRIIFCCICIVLPIYLQIQHFLRLGRGIEDGRGMGVVSEFHTHCSTTK